MKFKKLRRRISKTDAISIMLLIKSKGDVYKQYLNISDVPHFFDEMKVIGIGYNDHISIPNIDCILKGVEVYLDDSKIFKKK